MDFNFKNKVVIVTGSSSGIGAAAVLKFAKLLANVVVVGRNEEKLKIVADQLKNMENVNALVIKADMTKDEDVKKIIDDTVKKFGRIDILVNNAAVGGFSKLDGNTKVFDNVISTNLRSVYLLTSLATPYLKRNKGNIINVSSLGAVRPLPEFLAYSVSKAGLDMFTKCIAKTLASDGVRVNSVNPGPVQTHFQLTSGLTQEEEDEYYRSKTEKSPMGRISTTEEVADLILFIASDKADSITGCMHFMDNGLMYA